MARFANLLWYYTGTKIYPAAAQRKRCAGLRRRKLPGNIFPDVGGVLLADERLNGSHPVTIVGSKKDSVGQELWRAAELPTAYRRIEW